jgi:nitroreductase
MCSLLELRLRPALTVTPHDTLKRLEEGSAERVSAYGRAAATAAVGDKESSMNVNEAIAARQSVREYEDREVEPDKLLRVLEATRLAPSASNRQEWRFVVVQDQELRQKLAEAAGGQAFVGQAAVVIVACAVGTDHLMPCGLPSFSIDVAIALDHLSLVAVEEGLGTCWIGAFDQAKVKALLGIPDDVCVVELMPLGYPADAPRPKQRMGLDEIAMREHWNQPWQ